MSLGFDTELGVGPIRLGGKAGIGAGGVERGTWYEPIGDKDLVVQAQGGLGLGETEFFKGVGAAIDWNNGYLPTVPTVPTRVSPPRVSEWYTVGEPTIIRLPSTTTNVRRPYPVEPIPYPTEPIPSGPSLIEFSAGADLGPLHEGTRFSIGGGAPVQLQDNQHNLVGVNTGLSVGGLNTAFQTGLGVGK